MKISEFIEELEHMKYVHGDLDVKTMDHIFEEYVPTKIDTSEYSLENKFIIVDL